MYKFWNKPFIILIFKYECKYYKLSSFMSKPQTKETGKKSNHLFGLFYQFSSISWPFFELNGKFLELTKLKKKSTQASSAQTHQCTTLLSGINVGLKGDDITNYINVKHSCQEFSLFQIEIRETFLWTGWNEWTTFGFSYRLPPFAFLGYLKNN